MATAFVQSKVTRAAAADTTVTATFTSNVTAGNLIAVMASWDGNYTHFSSLTDSLGNTYTAVANVSDGVNPDRYALFYAKNISGGANTVTLTLTGSRALRILVVAEISGADTTSPLDQSGLNLQAAPGLGADAITSGSKTTLTDGQYIFGCTMAAGSWTINYTGGTGMTVRDNLATSGSDRAIIHQSLIQTSAGATAITATTDNSQTFVTGIMTFKATAGPTITSVSTGTPREGASLTITGTTFGASQGSGDVKINGVAQTVTAWSATSVVVTIVLGTNKFGSAYNVILRDTSLVASNTYAGITGLLPANSGLSYVDIGTPNTTSAYRLEASADLASGDQVEYQNKGSMVSVATDGVFTAGAGVRSFSFRVWTSGSGYGGSGVQTVAGTTASRMGFGLGFGL